MPTTPRGNWIFGQSGLVGEDGSGWNGMDWTRDWGGEFVVVGGGIGIYGNFEIISHWGGWAPPEDGWMDGLGGSFHVYLYLSVALLWGGSRRERVACWSGPAVGRSALSFFPFFHFFIFSFFFSKRYIGGFFFQILSVFNFESPISLMCIAQRWEERKKGRKGGWVVKHR